MPTQADPRVRALQWKLDDQVRQVRNTEHELQRLRAEFDKLKFNIDMSAYALVMLAILVLIAASTRT